MPHAPSARSIVALALLVGACSGKKDEERVLPPEAPEVAPAPAQPATPPSTAPAAPPQLGALACDQVASKALRDTYLGGKELRKQELAAATDVRCTLVEGDVETVVAASCPEARTGTVDDAIKAARDTHAGAKDLTGVGTAALLVETPKHKTVIAWDDDSACQIELRVPAATDAAAFAKAFLAELPPAPPAPPAEQPAEATGTAAPAPGSAAPPTP